MHIRPIQGLGISLQNLAPQVQLIDGLFFQLSLTNELNFHIFLNLPVFFCFWTEFAQYTPLQLAPSPLFESHKFIVLFPDHILYQVSTAGILLTYASIYSSLP